MANKKTTVANNNESDYIITCDNVMELATRVALTALGTIRRNSGGTALIDKLINAIIFQDNSVDGEDIVSSVKTCLWQVVGNNLFTDYVPTDRDIHDGNGFHLLSFGKKSGKALTIWRSGLTLVNEIITKHKGELKKTVYIENIDEGTLIAIPKGYDCDSFDEWDWYNYVVQALELNARQCKALAERYWRGRSISDTARTLGTSRQNAKKIMTTIGKKYLDIYQDIATYELDEMPEPPIK